MKRFYLSSVFLTLCFSLSAHDPTGWAFHYAPYYRTIHSVQILNDSSIIIAGGHERNDKIRSVSRSIDGGQTWDIVLDLLDSSMMKSVFFQNPVNGFAVGYEGGILKTTDGGQTWIASVAPGNAALRNLNSVFFINEQTGFIAGGNQTNDSIQTILKTTDGGINWTIVRDGFGYWLTSIFFVDETTGFAVGENGVALKTTNGGSNWTQMTLPGNTSQRDFNTVFFLNASTGFIAGGNKSNDSIQTILKTTDGGTNWNIISDNPGPWITSIYFPEQFPDITTGFSVGDKGTVLITEDTGDSWNSIAIPDSVNDNTTALQSVHFLNLDFGIATGNNGKLLVYHSPVHSAPSVQINYARDISQTSAFLSGSVNANGSDCKVIFEYATSSLFDNSIQLISDTVSGNSFIPVGVNLSGLNSNTIYYYRIKAINSSGAAYSETIQFYPGDNPIPNWDFEYWHTLSGYFPKDWIAIGGVTQTPSYDGSIAAALHKGYGNPFGGLLFAIPGDNGIQGGVPFPAKPDSVAGYFNYNIAPNDSAAILLLLKKNGTFITTDTFYYITGTSNGNFQRLSFPIAYSSPAVPDSMVIGVVSTVPFTGTPDSTSYLAIDNLSFPGATVNIPNYNFEQWDSFSTERLDSWFSKDDESPLMFPGTVFKTTDRVHGTYAARLQNDPVAGNSAGVFTSSESNSNNSPSFPVHGRHAVFHCFLKYFPENSDSLSIQVNMYKNGVAIGEVRAFIDTTISEYTLFSLPITYFVPYDIPDSATIQINAALNGPKPRGNSVLYVDNLSFDGTPTSYTHIVSMHHHDFLWKFFPNPARNKLVIEGTTDHPEDVIFSVLDLNGKLLITKQIKLSSGPFNFILDLPHVPSGCYLVALQQKNSLQLKKLIIGN